MVTMQIDNRLILAMEISVSHSHFIPSRKKTQETLVVILKTSRSVTKFLADCFLF